MIYKSLLDHGRIRYQRRLGQVRDRPAPFSARAGTSSTLVLSPPPQAGLLGNRLFPWQLHPSLSVLREQLQTTADCRALLAAPDGSSRKEHYLPKGERDPETAYRKRVDAALPSGFFRDALRTYAGMLSRGSWISLPASLSSVLSDVDGRGTDLGVFPGRC